MTLLVSPPGTRYRTNQQMAFILTLGCLFLIYIYNLCQLVGPSLKFEWNRLVSPRFEWTLKFERSPRIEGITLRSPRIECFTYFWGWSSTCYSNGLVQDCCISSALAMEIKQSCTKPSIFSVISDFIRSIYYKTSNHTVIPVTGRQLWKIWIKFTSIKP